MLVLLVLRLSLHRRGVAHDGKSAGAPLWFGMFGEHHLDLLVVLMSVLLFCKGFALRFVVCLQVDMMLLDKM
jgi:hypothetical protein